MKEMFEASVDGEAYDQDKFGQYFRPSRFTPRTGDPVIQQKHPFRSKSGTCC